MIVVDVVSFYLDDGEKIRCGRGLKKEEMARGASTVEREPARASERPGRGACYSADVATGKSEEGPTRAV